MGKVTSTERGTQVTPICAMRAAGSFLPPKLIFLRKKIVPCLMGGAPPQSVGYASSNGWTDNTLFLRWLEHFIKFTNASQQAPQIILLDGHNSHKTLEAVDKARQHGIHMLTFPPHCTHKMQPLDCTYFKALKAGCNTALDSWMTSNPGRRVTVYEMAQLFGHAYLRTATAEKAGNGF